MLLIAELKLPNVSPTFESVERDDVVLLTVLAVFATLLSVFVVVAMSVATSAPFIIVGAFLIKEVSSFVSSGEIKPGNALKANTPAVSPPIPPTNFESIPSSSFLSLLLELLPPIAFACFNSLIALAMSVVFRSIRLKTPICSLWFSELI